MARYGISTRNAYGVPMPFLRHLALDYRKQHELALELWSTEVHEARIFAGIIDDPKKVTREQMESWVKDIDSWDICDQVCNNLFVKTPFAYEKAIEWSGRKEEFVKRAGFVLMTQLAVHKKDMRDGLFIRFLPIIKREAADERNFVKKAVNQVTSRKYFDICRADFGRIPDAEGMPSPSFDKNCHTAKPSNAKIFTGRYLGSATDREKELFSPQSRDKDRERNFTDRKPVRPMDI